MTVKPETICAGDTVYVSWHARGGTRLFQVPLQPGESDQCVDSLIAGRTASSVLSEDSFQQRFQQNTVIYVEAHGLLGKPAHGCATVFVNAALPLAGIAQCNGPRQIRVIVSRPAGSQWSRAAKVGSVQNLNGVPVVVSHSGLVDTLSPGSESKAFAHGNDDGEWTIDYRLQDGPDCGQAGAKLPPSLSIRVLPLCAN